MPPKRTKTNQKNTDDYINELKALFDSDEEVEFFGFDFCENTSLSVIFQDESDGEEFLGFKQFILSSQIKPQTLSFLFLPLGNDGYVIIMSAWFLPVWYNSYHFSSDFD